MANSDNGFADRLRDFVDAHPRGWTHHDWLELLAELSDMGVDTRNPDRIGALLERQRLLSVLERLPVAGLGPKRRAAVVDRFGRLWELERASVDEVAELPSFHRSLAQSLHDALR